MFILTAVGPDRPGMAHAVAQILFENGCNIEDTTMTRLCGQFAQILVVEIGAQTDVSRLQNQLGALEKSHGLVTELTDVEETASENFAAPRWMLTAYGREKTGLLAKLTGDLSAKNVNVTDVQTRVASGGTVYVMLLELELPAPLGADELRGFLETQNPDLQISLREIEEETL